jgi:hypothetical protein
MTSENHWGAGTGRPCSSAPSPGCPSAPRNRQSFSPMTMVVWSLGRISRPVGVMPLIVPATNPTCVSTAAAATPEPARYAVTPNRGGPAGSLIKLPIISALRNKVRKSSANNSGSSPSTTAILSGPNPLSWETNSLVRAKLILLGSTARSIRSSRNRSRAVKRCSFKRLASICFASFLARSNSIAKVAACSLAFAISACATPSAALDSAAARRNSSARVESSAIRSFAFAVPSFAISESAMARFVSASLASTRSSENFSFMAPVLMVPQVPSSTKNAPSSNTPLKISNQSPADSAVSNILNLLFGACCVMWLAAMTEVTRNIYRSWRRLKR